MRCSSLPLAFLCGGSQRTDDGAVLVGSHNDAADDGTDAHRLMATWPDGDAPKEVVDELSESARIGYYTAAKMWRENISAWMPDSEAERYIEYDGLSGHVDRMSILHEKRTAVVLDFKFGQKDHNHKHQGFGYAWLIMNAFIGTGDIDTVTVHFAWVRTQELESYTVSRARAEEWYRELEERVYLWDGKYRTGDHCAHCPRGSSCPARRQLVRSEVETLTTVGIPDVTAMEPAQLVEFHRRLSVLDAVLKSAKANVRMEVERRGDVLDGVGNVLHLVEENGKRTVDTLLAWDVLNRMLEREELAACIDVRIGDVEDAVAKKAGRGKGAAAKRLLDAELKASGAVTHGKVKKLRLERTK